METYRQSANIVTRQIAGETLLIPITQVGVDLQQVYLLNETAAAVWALLREPRDAEALVTALAEDYEAEPEQLRGDVAETLQEFAARGFVQEAEGG